MKKKIAIEIINALIVLLWVYAAISKLLEFDTFKVQLSKSPLLTRFAGAVAIALPGVELLVAAALISKRFYQLGLYGTLFLLVAFTAYLIVITNFSHYIPCSCGGILSGMSWNTHIAFNCLFIVLTLVAVFHHATVFKENKMISHPI